MEFLTSALLSGLKLGADIFNSERGYHENRRNLEKEFEYNSALAQQQQDFAKERMQNAYQWTMKDLENSGLNPTLVMGGGGNATMTGGVGGSSVSAPTAQPGGIDITSALKLNKELGLLDAERKKIESETEVNNETSGKLQQETLYTIENTNQVRKNIKKIIADTNLSEMERQKKFVEIDTLLKQQEQIGEQIKILKSQGKSAEVQAQFAKAEAIQRQITGYLNSLANTAMAIKGTSALPINIHSNSSSAVYHQPFQLY